MSKHALPRSRVATGIVQLKLVTHGQDSAHSFDGGIPFGAALSILHTEFKACYGGRYMITARVGSTAIVFCTAPLKNSFVKMLHDDGSHPSSTIITGIFY